MGQGTSWFAFGASRNYAPLTSSGRQRATSSGSGCLAPVREDDEDWEDVWRCCSSLPRGARTRWLTMVASLSGNFEACFGVPPTVAFEELMNWLRKPANLSATIFVSWVLLGLFIVPHTISHVDEQLTWVDAFYFMIEIITTIGYGDFVPEGDRALLFAGCYVLTGVVVISSMVAAVTERIVNLEDRIVETSMKGIRFAVENPLFSRLPGAEAVAGRVANFAALHSDGGEENETLSPGRSAFLRALAIWLAFLVAGVVFFCGHPGEQKDVIEAFYMSVLTLTTVGFGDVTPSTQDGRKFAIVWMFLGTAAFANMVAMFSAWFLVQGRLRRIDRASLQDITCDDLFKKCHEGLGEEVAGRIYRADFILFMLKDMGVTSADLLESLSRQFDDLDRDGCGYLDESGIEHVKVVRTTSSTLRVEGSREVVRSPASNQERHVARFRSAPI